VEKKTTRTISAASPTPLLPKDTNPTKLAAISWSGRNTPIRAMFWFKPAKRITNTVSARGSVLAKMT
jgi:hypothetical protein